MSDIQFMERALELAQRGIGSVSPNPSVGCVVVHEGKIIGEGFTSPYGGPHAEVNAINEVKDTSLLPESTVYVTLEPCAHHGKTPPCADMLIRKKVKKVVIACRDPFEKVDGKGIEKLLQADVEVALGLLEQEASELNRRFFTFHQKKRPYVILKWAQTQDGFIAKENGDSKWISNAYSRQLVHKWRTEEDAIMVGKNTAIKDNPSLTSRYWEGKNPIRVLLDKELNVSTDSNIFSSEAPTLIFNSSKNQVQGNNKWVKVKEMNPKEFLTKLHHENVQSIMVEGGSDVLNSFIRLNCWDEARVFTSSIKFNNGINAPRLDASSSWEGTVQDDKLTIYKNHNG